MVLQLWLVAQNCSQDDFCLRDQIDHWFKSQ